MAGIADFFIELGSKFDPSGMNQAIESLGKVQKQTSLVDEISKRFVITLGDVMSISRSLAGQMWNVAEAAGAQELADKRLADAMKNQGVYTDEAFEANKRFAASMQEVTKYEDDAVEETMQLLTTFGLHDERLREVTKSTFDLASGMGIDLNAAAMLMGKAFAGETSTLSRYGIIVNESIPRTERFTAALKQVQDRFGGAASGEAQTFLGKIEQFQHRLGELKERIGNEVIPVFIFWMDKIKGVSDWLDKLIGKNQEAAVNTGKTWKDKLALLQEEQKKVEASIAIYGKYEDQLTGIQKINQNALHERLKLINRAIKAVENQADEEVKITKAAAKDKQKISAGELQNAQRAAEERSKIHKQELDGRKRNEATIAHEITAIRVGQDKIMSQSFTMAMNKMLVAYQSFGSVFNKFWIEIHDAVKDGFIYLLTNIQNGLISFSAAAGVIWEGMKKAFIDLIAEMATRWVMTHIVMKGITLAWKAIEVSAAAAVAAARAAAASAWALWGAIAIGASVGAAVMAFNNKFAKGVRNFAGGLAWVGEEGPELVNLPAGSDVFSNPESRAMVGAGGGYVFNITMHGADKKYADIVAQRIYQKVSRLRKT